MTANFNVTRSPDLTGCPTVDLTIYFSGADSDGGDDAPTRTGVSFSGTVGMTARLTYLLTPDEEQLVQVDASVECEDDPGVLVQPDSEFVNLPTYSSVAEPATPEPDPQAAPSLDQEPGYLFHRSEGRDLRGAIGTCELASLAHHHAGALRSMCHDLSLAAAGASDVEDPDTSPAASLRSADFSSRVFQARASQQLCAGSRSAPRTRSAMTKAAAARCRRLDRVGHDYLRDLNETAWLYRALAQSLRRPGSPSSDGELFDLGDAASLVYRARLGELASAERLDAGRIAHMLTGSENPALPEARWRRAVAALRRGRLLPRATLRAYPSLKKGIRAARLARTLRHGPTSLAQLLAGIGRVAPAVGRARNQLPESTATLLADWLGSAAAAPLQQSCGAAYEAALNALADGPAGVRRRPGATEYGSVLAALLLGRLPPRTGPRCVPHFAAVIAPLSDWLSASPTEVIPSVANAANGLTQAQGLAIAADGTLLVADEAAARIDRYSPAGQLLSTIGGPGTGPGQFTSPVSVAVDPTGDIYVSDFGTDQIDKFAPDGSFELSWGATGSDPGELDHPTGIAWNPATQQLDVADAGNDRLESFTATGQLAWSTSPTQGDPDYLTRPRGIAVAPDGTIAVAEADLNAPRVVFFSPTGTYLAATSPDLAYDPDNDPTGFVVPYGLAYDPAGDLWVADRGGTLTELDGQTVERVFQNFTPAGSALAPTALAFSGSNFWLLDFDGQQILQLPDSSLTPGATADGQYPRNRLGRTAR